MKKISKTCALRQEFFYFHQKRETRLHAKNYQNLMHGSRNFKKKFVHFLTKNCQFLNPRHIKYQKYLMNGFKEKALRKHERTNKYISLAVRPKISKTGHKW